MRFIEKGEAPESYKKWESKQKNLNWNDFSKPTSSYYEIYCELRKELISQQRKMCCYCEIVLCEDTAAHVEHFKDKHHNPRETFDFTNLLASCQHNDSCGHKKGHDYFDSMVSPLDCTCQERFTYTGTGKVIPVDENDTDAQKTIELLDLNCKRLQDMRNSIIQTIDHDWTDFNDTLANCHSWYQGFPSVIEYIAAKY